MTEPTAVPVEEELYKASTRGRLHVRGCSHLQDTEPSRLVRADATDRATLQVCSECDKEIRGIGRTEYPSLDVAFEALRFPVGHRLRMREIAAGVDFTKVWAPQSRSYVGVGHLDGRPAAAYFNRGFVDVRLDEGGYERHPMPTYAGGGRADAGHRPGEREASTCPSCFMELPMNGVCDSCE